MAHHGSNGIPEELLKAMEEENLQQFEEEALGPTNRHPAGKLTDADEGEIRFAVGAKDSKVVLDFGSPVHWIGLSPEQAVQLAQLLLDKARAASDDVLTIRL